MTGRTITMVGTCCMLLLIVGCEPAEPEVDEPQPEPPQVAEQPDEPEPVEQEEFVDEGPDDHLMYAPDDIEWDDGPESLEEGAEFAMLEGDAGEREIFTMRIRMPDEFRISPHTHTGVERVTIIDGTFRLGHGEEFEPEEATALEAGSYFSIPPGHEHFAQTDGETTIQLSSLGPWEIEYIDPDDDPRERDVEEARQ